MTKHNCQWTKYPCPLTIITSPLIINPHLKYPLAFSPFFYYFLPMPRSLKENTAFLFLMLFSLLANRQSIYKKPSGKNYHLCSCHMVRNVKENITHAQAMELGVETCKVCRTNINQLRPSIENKSVGEGRSVQCKGLTNKGTRCKHQTHIANWYCFQHQPRRN